MEFLNGLVWFAVAVIVVWNCFQSIPIGSIGLGTILGKRIRRWVASEGIAFKLPFVSKYLLFSIEIPSDFISVSVLSKDDQGIKVDGLIDWQIDNPYAFFLVTKSIKEKLAATVQSELGKISGLRDIKEFKDDRTEIELLVNCVLRLPRRPDFWVNKKQKPGGGFELIMGQIDLTGVTDPIILDKLRYDKWNVPSMPNDPLELDVIQFYHDNITRVQLLLDLEIGLQEQKSKAEKDYGVDIKIYRLPEVGYSAETQKALEEKQQATLKMKAVEEKEKTQIRLIDELKGIGLSPQEATNASQLIMGLAEKKIISLEGINLADVLKTLGIGGHHA